MTGPSVSQEVTIYHLGVLSLLLGGLLLEACGSYSHPEAPSEAVTGVDSGAVLLHAAYSGFGEPDRFVVRDSAQWAAAWANAFARQTPIPPRRLSSSLRRSSWWRHWGRIRSCPTTAATEAKTRNLLYRGLAELREALRAMGIGPANGIYLS